MPRFSSSGRYAALLAAAFLLSGLLHVFLYAGYFADSIVQLFCGSAVVLWALSVQRRVTDGRLRRTLLWAAAFMLLFNVLQCLRYSLTGDDSVFER